MNGFLKELYKKKIGSHRQLGAFYRDAEPDIQGEVLQMADQLYRGGKNESQLLHFMKQMKQIRSLKRACNSNLPRTIRSVNKICHTIKQKSAKDQSFLRAALFGEYDATDPAFDGFKDEADFDSQMRSVVHQTFDKKLRKELQDQNETDNALDSLFGRNSDGDADHLMEHPEFAQWLEDNLDAERLRNILKTFGKFKSVITKRKKEIAEEGYDDMRDVVLGNDLSMVLPSEFISLCSPETEDLFYLAYANEELMEIVTESKAEKEEGPIAIMMDVSGSMDAKIGTSEVSRFEMAAGFTLAICKQLELDNRDWNVGFYDEDIRGGVGTPKGGTVADLFKQFVTIGYGGGTDLGRAFSQIADTIGRDEDFLVITDGDDNISKQHQALFSRVKEEREIKLSTLLIGKVHANETMRAISDSIICVSNEGTERGMIQMIETEILPGSRA